MTCDHKWMSIGCSTVCEPPVYHSVCPVCRLFRHRRYSDDGREFVEEEWFTSGYAFENFDFEKFTENNLVKSIRISGVTKFDRIKLKWHIIHNLYGFGILETIFFLFEIYIFKIPMNKIVKKLHVKRGKLK